MTPWKLKELIPLQNSYVKRREIHFTRPIILDIHVRPAKEMLFVVLETNAKVSWVSGVYIYINIL